MTRRFMRGKHPLDPRICTTAIPNDDPEYLDRLTALHTPPRSDEPLYPNQLRPPSITEQAQLDHNIATALEPLGTGQFLAEYFAVLDAEREGQLKHERDHS